MGHTGTRIVGWISFGLIIASGAGEARAQRRVTETAVPFYCSGDACFVDADRCDQYAQDRRDLGQRSSPCRESSRMACFEYTDVAEEEGYSNCYPSAAICGRHLRQFRRGNYWSNAYDSPRFSGISECQTFRYSRRRAEELARAERERREAEAAIAAERASYQSLAAGRDVDLMNLVLGGAVLSRAPHCDVQSGECTFDPESPHPAVSEAECVAGVNPDGRLAFVCYTARGMCVATREALVAAQREQAIPLRITADCFTAWSGDSGTNYFVIDEHGEEVRPDPPIADAI